MYHKKHEPDYLEQTVDSVGIAKMVRNGIKLGAIKNSNLKGITKKNKKPKK